MNGMLSEFVQYLAMPGKLSYSCWQDAYTVLQNMECGKEEVALCGMISILSRVARSRKERLPDVLHNMMVLNSGGVKMKEFPHLEEGSKIKVQAYIKMLGRTK